MGYGQGGHRNNGDDEDKRHKGTGGKAVKGKAVTTIGKSVKDKNCGSDQVCRVYGGARWGYARTSPLFLRVGTTRVARATRTAPSAVKNRRPSCVIHQSIDVGVVVRSLGNWGVLRLYVMLVHHAICLTQQSEYNATMRTASDVRYPVEG